MMDGISALMDFRVATFPRMLTVFRFSKGLTEYRGLQIAVALGDGRSVSFWYCKKELNLLMPQRVGDAVAVWILLAFQVASVSDLQLRR